MKTVTFMSNRPDNLSDFHSYRLLSIDGKPVANPEGYVKNDFGTYGYELHPEEIVATIDGYSQAGEHMFVKTFVNAAHSPYRFEEDILTQSPICTPWHWASSPREKEIWLFHSDNPAECGKRWAEYCQRNGYFEVFNDEE